MMKTLLPKIALSIIMTVLISGLGSEVVAQDFEGVIYYEIPEMTRQGMGEMPYMVKDSKVRMEFGKGAQGGVMIFMPDQNKMTFILEAMKGYMTMDMDDPDSPDNSDENTNMVKKETTKTIAGRSCEVWEVTDTQNTYQLCVAKGMGNFMMPQNPMAQTNTPKWAKEAMSGGFMPLEVIEISGGGEELKMRATKIEEKSLSASLFEVPEGYNDMSSMMKQMMNQNKNR
jgi:hypothetical protein